MTAQVTQLMLKVGAEEFLSWDRLDDDPRQIVEAVFLAMQEAAPRDDVAVFGGMLTITEAKALLCI